MEAGEFTPAESGRTFIYGDTRILTLKKKGNQESQSLKSDDILRLSYSLVEGKGPLWQRNGDYQYVVIFLV